MNHDTPSTESAKQRILDRIREGDVLMRPRWHFMLRTLLVAIGGIIVGLVVLYLISFVVFMLRQTGVAYVPALGFAGMVRFLISLPWLLVIAALAFILVLEVLVRKYSFAYRRPLVYSLVIVLVVVGAGSYLVSASGMHTRLLQAAVEQRLPIAGPVYRAYGKQQIRGVHPGTVLEASEEGIVILNHRGEEINVIIDARTRLRPGAAPVTGDRIVITGEREGAAIRARGVIWADGGWPTPPPGREGVMLRQMKYRGR